jgi:hypothetical protein
MFIPCFVSYILSIVPFPFLVVGLICRLFLYFLFFGLTLLKNTEL